MAKHPIESFRAPMNITAGEPLKDLLDAVLVGLIGKSFATQYEPFALAQFKREACAGLEDLTLMQRSSHIADALATQLPNGFGAASKILIASLGPVQTRTEGNGLRSFFYMPHSSFIAAYGANNFQSGMQACYELTQCFTAEFAVRALIERHQDRALEKLLKWTLDKNVHVRRLCSEGSRPRLPWASRLPVLQADPELALPILEALKNDPELYVRRSVANHLGDLCKDHPDWVFKLCRRWIREVVRESPERAKQRHWMIRHAVRHPAKKRVAAALRLREQARP